MEHDSGFVAALDQSGGSTPKALKAYGIGEDAYANEDEMFALVHAMRTRIMTSPSFRKERVLGAILFKETMERTVAGKATADYLWEEKGIVPILKIDNGLAEEDAGVQMLKPMPELESLLYRAQEKHIFGTKMRSVVQRFNEGSIRNLVEQQFAIAKRIIAHGLVPIIEPEVHIHAEQKADIETVLEKEIMAHLNALAPNERVMLKLTLPEQDNLYANLIAHAQVVRVLALSGGYSRADANARLARNNGMTASFSRALTEGLSEEQSQEAFDATLYDAIESIYHASVT